MKKLKILGAAIVMLFVVSCGDDDSSSNNNSNNQQQINEIIIAMQQGKWRVTTYVDSGIDKTNNFEGYRFNFGVNGRLSAVKAGNDTVPGTWYVTNRNNNDFYPDNSDIDFHIEFFSSPNFTDLNDDWDINERNANRISLIDESGGNGGTDILVFEKIQ